MKRQQRTLCSAVLLLWILVQSAFATTRYESADVPKEIAPTGRVTSVIEVAKSGAINNLVVELDISFVWDEDLDVYLLAPDGTRVELFTDVGGFGANFAQTVLDDAAAVSISDGEAPFTGRYRPEGHLSDLIGMERQGIWKLEITNDGEWFTGTLNAWAVVLDGEAGGESCLPPPEPMNPDPADGATGVPTDIVLSWRLGAGAATAFRFLAATGEEEPDPFTLFELQTNPAAAVPLDDNCGVYALDFSPEGELYGCDEYALWKLTLGESGVSCAKIGDFRSTTDESVLMTGLAFHPDGTLYGSTFDYLSYTSVIYTIDEMTALVREVCRISVEEGFIWAIDFSPDGKLYAAFTDVMLVDLETRSVQPLCTLMATDIDLAPDGFLYVIDNESRILYQIDPSLGIIIAEYGPYEIAPWGLASEILDGTPLGSSDSAFVGDSTGMLGDIGPTEKYKMGSFRAKLRRILQEPSRPRGDDASQYLKSYSVAASNALSTASTIQDSNRITYDVFLGTISPPTTLVCDDIETRQCDPGSLQPCTTYYWQVMAENVCGEQTAGPIWSFTTKSIPADFDEDCDVDLADLATFASYWLYGEK